MFMSEDDASKSLGVLCEEYWQARLINNPLYATALGDRRYDDLLPDITPQGIARIESQYESFLERAQSIPQGSLTISDKVTRSALLTDIQSELAYLRCHLEEWTVDPLGGPQVEFQNLESYQPVSLPKEGRSMVMRWKAMGSFMDCHVANLQHGLGSGKVSVKSCVDKVIEEIQDLQSKPATDWAFLRPLTVAHQDWSEVERKEFYDGLADAVKECIRPAFARYLEFLKNEILPRARPQGSPGIMHVANGAKSYRQLIQVHTSLDISPDELHETGLREVARINGEMEVLGEKVFDLRERKLILQRLRSDPSLYFRTRDEVAEKAESALQRAKASIPKWFGRLPKADCDVVRMEEHEEKHSTIAYYRQPSADGSRPGRYYINTSAPETRPRYEAEVLAYHESIPGHHLQIAIAQELEGMPQFRKYSGVTAFIEGWGLYTERLAEEMGLYSSDLDRIGVLSYDAWRASRLVVDTGMHARGWTRQQSIDFMLGNTALAENNIMNEVDRYITWPGQALAYKTGQLEILRLREEAKRRLGSKFDIRKFHDMLLGDGAVALGTLQQIVNSYVEARLAE
jgi:uncharacterized protein (DUF885 family)